MWADLVRRLVQPGAVRVAWERQMTQREPAEAELAAKRATLAGVEDQAATLAGRVTAQDWPQVMQASFAKQAATLQAQADAARDDIARLERRARAAQTTPAPLAEFEAFAARIVADGRGTPTERRALLAALRGQVTLYRAGGQARWRWRTLLLPTGRVEGTARRSSHSTDTALDLLAAD